MTPNLVIIGAQKAGSTFIQECLAEHPDVYMKMGEVPFFEDPDYHESSIARFEQLFHAAGIRKMIGFKRPNYLPRPECPIRLHQHLPNAKLIASLRNPAERAVSAYFHYMRSGFIPITPFEQGMHLILTGAWRDKYPKSQDILEYGLYAQQIDRYDKLYSNSALHILLFDDIRANSLKTLQGTCAFLDISTEFNPKSLKKRPMASPYSLCRQRLLRIIHPLYHRYNKDRTRVYNRSGPAKWIRQLTNHADRLLLAKIMKGQKPNRNSDIYRRLIEYYQEENKRLQDRLNRDLSHWITPSQ